jgi:alpha-beta hydrolase superfamily lysophospholipase
MTGPAPQIRVLPPSDGRPVSAVVIVLHGGRAHSTAPVRRNNLAYQRMRPFTNAIHRDTRHHGVAVWQLRYRVRGWNGDNQDPVRDVRSVLRRIADAHPSGLPVVLVGHSMGGRTALYAGGDRNVVAICALAPWIEPEDLVEQLAARLVVIAHGDQDRMTDPGQSRRYAAQAAAAGATVAHFEVIGDKHAMLRRPADWHGLASDTVRYALGISADAGQLARTMAQPADQRLAVPLAAA